MLTTIWWFSDLSKTISIKNKADSQKYNNKSFFKWAHPIHPFNVNYGFEVIRNNTEIAVFIEYTKWKLTGIRTASQALTPLNIMTVLDLSGIFPLNPEIFSDSDFISFYFSDWWATAVQSLEKAKNPEKVSKFPQ